MTAQPLGEHGTNQHTEDLARTKGGSLHYLLPPSRGSAYLTARIARDRPDIWERMRLGEFESVAAAAREAGIKMPKPRRAVTLGDNVERAAIFVVIGAVLFLWGLATGTGWLMVAGLIVGSGGGVLQP